MVTPWTDNFKASVLKLLMTDELNDCSNDPQEMELD
jgi:hypothetical protein